MSTSIPFLELGYTSADQAAELRRQKAAAKPDKPLTSGQKNQNGRRADEAAIRDTNSITEPNSEALRNISADQRKVELQRIQAARAALHGQIEVEPVQTELFTTDNDQL